MTAPSDSNGNSQHLTADPLRRVVVRKIGKRNCASCGKPMEGEHHLQKWHVSCKRALPGYFSGYNDGRRSMTPKEPKERSSERRRELPIRPKLASISALQRQQIEREVLGKAKAEIERELAETKVRLDLIQREKAAADCHNRMLKAGFELPPFRFHPDVETIHAEQQEVAR